MDGSWKGNTVTRWGVAEGQNDLVKIPEVVPADVKAKVDELKAGMKAGTFEVFTGPILTTPAKSVWPRALRLMTSGVARSTSTSRALKARSLPANKPLACVTLA